MAEIAQVIQYEGDNSTFIWKHPVEDFNTGSQLVVHESQEALFYMNGQAFDLFGPGRHTLTTQNIPLIQKFFNRMTGDVSPFHCEVYFINKTEQMTIKWGTDSKVEYVEPVYQFPIQIGASGEMSLRAEDARKILIKLVGTEDSLTQEVLVRKFRAFLMTRIKTYLAQLIRTERINIFEIDEYLTRMSEELRKKLAPDFAEYGVALEQFFITTVVKPEEDKIYQQFKQIHFRQYADIAEAKIRQQVGVIEQQTEAQRMVIESQGLAQKRQIEGYTYQQERSFDVAQEAAGNPGAGEFTSAGIGLGMMAGVGGTMGAAVGGIMGETMQSMAGGRCPKCGAQTAPGARFCSQCGGEINAGAICPKCKAQVEAGAKFCPKCGAAIEKPKCPECGAAIEAGAKFCSVCGKEIGGEGHEG